MSTPKRGRITSSKLYRYGGMAVRVIERREEAGVEHIQAIRRRVPVQKLKKGEDGKLELQVVVEPTVMLANKGTLKALAPLPKKYRKRLRDSALKVEQDKARRARLREHGIEVAQPGAAPASETPWTDLRKPVASGAIA